MRIILLIIAIFIFTLSSAHAASAIRETDMKRIQPVADQSLRTFIRLIDMDNYKSMGFTSTEEAGSALLGTPLKEYMVRLDNLKNYQPGADPHALLTDTGQITYPVQISNDVRSAIKLAEIKGEWKAVSHGSGNIYQAYERVRIESMRKTALDKSEYFEVRIPALSLFFLGYDEKDTLMLISVMENQGYDFKMGESMPAGRVFEMLVEPARKHDGEPR